LTVCSSRSWLKRKPAAARRSGKEAGGWGCGEQERNAPLSPRADKQHKRRYPEKNAGRGQDAEDEEEGGGGGSRTLVGGNRIIRGSGITRPLNCGSAWQKRGKRKEEQRGEKEKKRREKGREKKRKRRKRRKRRRGKRKESDRGGEGNRGSEEGTTRGRGRAGRWRHPLPGADLGQRKPVPGREASVSSSFRGSPINSGFADALRQRGGRREPEAGRGEKGGEGGKEEGMGEEEGEKREREGKKRGRGRAE